MVRLAVILMFVAGILVGSVMTFVVSSLAIGDDIFAQKAKVEQQERFIDGIAMAARYNRQKNVRVVEATEVNFECNDFGCLIGQGEMIRRGMSEYAVCLWRRPQTESQGPILEVTRETHFLDLTGAYPAKAESVICRDENGVTFSGELQY